MFVDKKTDYTDDLVYVILKRTMKELRVKPHLSNKAYNTLKGAVKICGDSRKNHPTENYYENITYWPGDMGINGTMYKLFSILFFARIITNVMPIDKSHIKHSSMKILNNFNEYVSNMLFRIVNYRGYDEELAFFIKYGEEIGEAILACQDVGKKHTWGYNYIPSSQGIFFDKFYPKHIKELQSNTFLI